MPTKPIPPRPNLEFDRKAAKALLHQLKENVEEARNRFLSAHPRKVPDDPKLADALLVIAREYGFNSWPEWKAFVECRTFSREKQAAIVVKSSCSSDIARARVLLQADPSLAREDLAVACACGEVGRVRAILKLDAKAANTRTGPNNWEPIQYVCFSRWLRADKQRAEGIIAVATLLLAHGADPNVFHSAGKGGPKSGRLLSLVPRASLTMFSLPVAFWPPAPM